MKTAAAYIRVSTDEQTEHSPDSQLKEIRNYADRHGLIFAPSHIYIDAGVSGRKAKKRPQFLKMIATAKGEPSPFSVVLVWKFSRFARNQEESIVYKSLLNRECGVEVVSITEETQDKMFGSLVERMIEWMDEFYSIRLGEEVRTKMTYVAETGKIQTAPSFGFSKNSEGEYVLNPDEAEWVLFMAESLLQKKSLRWIAKELNSHGVRTHRGNKFEPRTVRYILKNLTNTGASHWTPNREDHENEYHPYSDSTIVVDGVCDHIYTREYYDKIIAELDTRAENRKKYDKPDTVKKHWLSGFLKCSNCGSTMVYSLANKGFQCYKYGKSLCDVSHFISASKIEESVIQAIKNVTVNDKFIKSVTKPPKKADHKKDIRRLEGMLQRAKIAYMEEIDTLEEYAANKERIEKEILKFKKEDEKATAYRPAEDVRRQFAEIVDLLSSDSEDAIKRAALGEIVESIVFSRPNTAIKIYFRL